MALRLIIHGRVQGVGYRAWACREARLLGVRGWVRNRTDGTVELVAEGADGPLQEFALRCEHGPLAARVTSIDRFETDDRPETGFIERPSS
jgi:acylphosphatase